MYNMMDMSNLDEFEKYRGRCSRFSVGRLEIPCEELDSLKEDIDKVAVVRDNDDLRFRRTDECYRPSY